MITHIWFTHIWSSIWLFIYGFLHMITHIWLTHIWSSIWLSIFILYMDSYIWSSIWLSIYGFKHMTTYMVVRMNTCIWFSTYMISIIWLHAYDCTHMIALIWSYGKHISIRNIHMVRYDHMFTRIWRSCMIHQYNHIRIYGLPVGYNPFLLVLLLMYNLFLLALLLMYNLFLLVLHRAVITVTSCTKSGLLIN